MHHLRIVACVVKMHNLKGKVVIITGGAKGIGAATVRRFLDEGAKFVGFIDVDEKFGSSLETELLRKHGKDVAKFFKCDVTKDEELFGVFNYTVKHYGYIDVVMNNAGICNDTIHKKEIEINFTALVTSTLKALEMMRKDKGGAGGTIINVSSIGALGLQTDPSLFVYCGTKSAILLFSANLGMESYFSHTGVRVITMCFGLTTTDIVANVKGIDDICTQGMIKKMSQQKSQTSEAAAAGVVEAFENAKTGSTWFVTEGEVTDISDRVTKAYQVLLGEIKI